MNFRIAALTTLGVLTVFSGAVYADPREDMLEAMGKCAAVADDKARLGCYDAVAPRLRDVLNTPSATLAGPPTKEEEKSWFGFDFGNLFGGASGPQTTPQQFGAPTPPPDLASSQLDSITAKVTNVSFTLDAKFIVFLDNGQIWQQIQGETGVARFNRPVDSNTVTVTRGILGSFNLFINDSGRGFKVQRLK
jgi:hypothetical protein